MFIVKKANIQRIIHDAKINIAWHISPSGPIKYQPECGPSHFGIECGPSHFGVSHHRRLPQTIKLLAWSSQFAVLHKYMYVPLSFPCTELVGLNNEVNSNLII
jgi:hypothetical protein